MKALEGLRTSIKKAFEIFPDKGKYQTLERVNNWKKLLVIKKNFPAVKGFESSFECS